MITAVLLAVLSVSCEKQSAQAPAGYAQYQVEVGKRLKYPMSWQEIGELDNKDFAAIFAYLRNIKPVSNKVPR